MVILCCDDRSCVAAQKNPNITIYSTLIISKSTNAYASNILQYHIALFFFFFFFFPLLSLFGWSLMESVANELKKNKNIALS